MNHEPGPFEKALAELTKGEDIQRQLSEHFQANFRGLYDAALLRGGDPDDMVHYINLASRLAEIQTTTDTTERRNKERDLLAEFVAYEPPQLVIDATLAYFPMDPLTEKDAGLVADKIAEREVFLDRVEVIDSKVESLKDDYTKKTGEPIDFNEFEHGYLLRFIGDFSSYVYETSVEEKPLKQANLLETLNIMSDKANFHPAVRYIVTSLLKDSDSLDT